jgi:RNA polymerase sigma-70 factor (ECF subfamily)
MSLEAIVQRIRDAFDMLNRREFGATEDRPTPAPRTRAVPPSSAAVDVPSLSKEGFAEEAMPWMGAVHRFALRLTRGDEDRAADLVQDAFLKAYRSWHLFERGTSCKSWLFTICKNSHLHVIDQARTRHEVAEADLDASVEALAVADVHMRARGQDLDGGLFDGALDARVVAAIDALPDDHRDVVVLSDLADLNYNEISLVLGVPVGTVKSRLFRARRRLQESLIDYAADAGLIQDASA